MTARRGAAGGVLRDAERFGAVAAGGEDLHEQGVSALSVGRKLDKFARAALPGRELRAADATRDRGVALERGVCISSSRWRYSSAQGRSSFGRKPRRAVNIAISEGPHPRAQSRCAWIVGNEACVVVDWQGFADYAKPKG
jgi:hypothetical protein